MHRHSKRTIAAIVNARSTNYHLTQIHFKGIHSPMHTYRISQITNTARGSFQVKIIHLPLIYSLLKYRLSFYSYRFSHLRSKSFPQT